MEPGGASATSPATRIGLDPTDSAPYVPRSLVIADGFDWGDDRPPGGQLADSIIYEVHVKGFTKLHTDVPTPAARHVCRAGSPGRHCDISDGWA